VISDRLAANIWHGLFEMMRAIEVPGEFMADRPMNLPPQERKLFSEE
jgi:antitoxin VapB